MIERSSIHRICSGQVIVDLRSAVKELVENGLDAGASSISVLLEDGGFQRIQVVDNGVGIGPQDFKAIGLKHYTSKLRTFEQLSDGVDSLGFRGEAISSLCALSRSLEITTRRADDVNGVRLIYDRNGVLQETQVTSHPCGTTVEVKELFQPAPVRLESYRKRHRRELNQVITLMQDYAIARPEVTFRLVGDSYRPVQSISTRFGRPKDRGIETESNRSSQTVSKTLLTTSGRGTMKEAILAVFGVQQVASLEKFCFKSDSDIR